MELEALTTLQHFKEVLIAMEQMPDKDEYLAGITNTVEREATERMYYEIKNGQTEFRKNVHTLASTVFFLEDCLME